MRPPRISCGIVICLAAAAAGAHAQGTCQYYVAPAPAGSDGNPGTAAQPWATLDHASARALALGGSNCTVTFADGVYTGGNSLYERFATPTTFRAANPYRAVLQNNSRAVSLFGARNMVFEGFEFRHDGPGAAALVVQVQQDGVNWAENVVFRNNVFHDSWNNDILKINNGARFITVEGNIFYNQTGSDEHMDVNSVTDVVIQDNIFFNDFAGSGRVNGNDTSSFIVIKDSNGADDGLTGSERITVRRNVFLNWEGSSGSNFVLVGEDGNPYHEGKDILVENNLMIGNSGNVMRAAFGVKGGRDIRFRNNTVVGNLPTLAYAFRLNQEGANPPNQNVSFHNNVWSDPTGTMGSEGGGGNDFSDGLASETVNLALDRNLYWNGPAAIPPGDQVSPLVHDTRRVVANPQLPTNQAGIVLPRWNGTAFASGNATVRQEFLRLVSLYGAIPAGSPAQDQADPALAPADDILGRPRTVPDLGAFEIVDDTAPTGYFPLAPCRLADTRGPAGPSGGPALAANTVRVFPASGACGVPASARAVALNVTAVGPTRAGNLRLFPAGAVAPNASTLNFAVGRTRANNALVRLGAGGSVAVSCDMPGGAGGQTHLVLDVAGYFQ
ncbi:MAG TPA: hypothetical protein VF310_04085 [Vicinamibacteria bacterium]